MVCLMLSPYCHKAPIVLIAMCATARCGDSPIKRAGVLVGNFERNLKSY